MSEITLKDLIQMQGLQHIQSLASKATGLAGYVMDLDGPITQISNATEFCTDIIKKSESANRKYQNCENSVIEQAFRTGRSCVNICENGLAVAAIPFAIKGKCIGASVFGHVFVEKQDENKLRKAAQDAKIDEEKYLSAARKVKVIPRQQVEAIADMLFGFNSIIVDLAYQRYVMDEKAVVFKQISDSLKSYLGDAEKLLSTNDSTIKDLSRKFEELNQLSDSATQKLENTSDTVRVIQNIALNTRILGFNASIEASRAKESGKGFGVIAQEVRSLADVSKNSAEKIEEIIQAISETTNQMRTTVFETNEAVNTSFSTMTTMTKLLESMREIADKLV